MDTEHTVLGNIVHERAHDAEIRSYKSPDVLEVRGLHVISRSMGITGSCDVVEFHRDPRGISLHGEPGTWQPYPIEYKKGKPKVHKADEAQLCAQAMCLEDVLARSIPGRRLVLRSAGASHSRMSQF